MGAERPRLVLVGGGTASGKSTIVSAFVAQTGATHIGHDRYYRDAPDPAQHNFDHPDALETALLLVHLDQLLAGGSAELPCYGFPQHRRLEATERVVAAGLIVVEGILVLAEPGLVSRADLVVFVDAPEPVRLARRIDRDGKERGRSAESVRAQFATTVAPSHAQFVQPAKFLAELVLDGTAPVETSVAQLIAAVGP
jgi:uridine kinase